MAYDPSKPAQVSIKYGGQRHLIQDGIEYAFHPPHDPLDAEKAAAREREIEAQRAATAPRVTLAPGEELTELGRGVYMIDGPNGDRGPYVRAQVAHLLGSSAGSSADVPQQRAAPPMALAEGEKLVERNPGWWVVENAAGVQIGPARRQKDVAHLLPGGA